MAYSLYTFRELPQTIQEFVDIVFIAPLDYKTKSNVIQIRDEYFVVLVGNDNIYDNNFYISRDEIKIPLKRHDFATAWNLINCYRHLFDEDVCENFIKTLWSGWLNPSPNFIGLALASLWDILEKEDNKEEIIRVVLKVDQKTGSDHYFWTIFS